MSYAAGAPSEILLAVDERLTGSDLRRLRQTRDIRATALAEAWPCTRGNVTRVEASLRPSRLAIRRYLDALMRAEAQA